MYQFLLKIVIYQNKIHYLPHEVVWFHDVICSLSVAFHLLCGKSGLIMSVTVYLVLQCVILQPKKISICYIYFSV